MGVSFTRRDALESGVINYSRMVSHVCIPSLVDKHRMMEMVDTSGRVSTRHLLYSSRSR